MLSWLFVYLGFYKLCEYCTKNIYTKYIYTKYTYTNEIAHQYCAAKGSSKTNEAYTGLLVHRPFFASVSYAWDDGGPYAGNQTFQAADRKIFCQ